MIVVELVWSIDCKSDGTKELTDVLDAISIDVCAAEETICHRVAVVLVHDVDEDALLRQLCQLVVVLRAEPLVLGLSREGHDRDRYVLRPLKSVSVIYSELIDAVGVVAEQADDPLVRAVVDFAVVADLIVLHHGVLPLKSLI